MRGLSCSRYGTRALPSSAQMHGKGIGARRTKLPMTIPTMAPVEIRFDDGVVATAG